MSDQSDFSRIDIVSKFHSYEVVIGTGQFKEIALRHENLIIADRRFQSMLESITEQTCLFIDAVESKKTLSTVEELVGSMQVAGVRRNSTVLAVGGGIIQDVATLASSLFMRGIAWEYAPTTLLAMADSCIGGKSSINVGQYKNIAGNFYPPQMITIDPHFCNTLESVEVIAGICEAVKICFADRKKAFDEFLQFTEIDNTIPPPHLAKIIELSLRTKKLFIEEDEFDDGIRLHLNFGHTFGHAIEAAGNFSITHGVAVGVGMQFAIDLANRLSPSNQAASRTESLNIYLTSLLKNVPHLAEHLNAIDADQLFDKFESDKKHTDKYFIMILPAKDGFLGKESVNKDALFKSLFKESFKYIQECYEIQ